MTALEVFTYADLTVRTVVRDGEPWFVAADVCAVLGIGNPRQAVSYLDDDEVDQAPVITNDGSNRELPTNLVTESGLYSLILRSRKPEAKAFKRWVTELASSHYHPRTGELVLDAPQVRITAKGLGELHKRLAAGTQLVLAGP